MNLIDQQQAQAADGNVWTDVAMLMNFYQSTTVANSGSVLGWAPPQGSNLTGKWYTWGQNAGNPAGSYSGGGLTWTALSVPAGAGLTPGPFAFDVTDDGSILVMGGTPGSSSNSKFRESTDGTTWNARSSSQTNTAGVGSIKWIEFLGLFIAGHTNGVIETSPDAQTWTDRSSPLATSLGQFATDGTTVVVVQRNGTDFAYSTNGTSWTSGTLPITAVGAVTYNSRLGKFYAFGATSIASSSDGVTWSTSGLSAPGGLATTAYALSSGRLLITSSNQTGHVAYSTDAFHWKYIEVLDITAPACIAISGDGQMLCCDGGSPATHVVSLRSY